MNPSNFPFPLKCSCRWPLLILSLLLILSSCSSEWTGFIAHDDEYYFQSSPRIVTDGEESYVSWHNADNPIFFMYSQSKMRGDSVIIGIPVTTSSGNCARQWQYYPIIGSEKAVAINKGKAFWESQETLVSLDVEQISTEELKRLVPKKD